MDFFSGILEWFARFWETLTWGRIALVLSFTVISIIASYGLIVIGMIKIPADYFSSTYVKEINRDEHFSLRWAAFIIKNTVGFLLIIAGVIMIFTPGPGVPTILLGLMMMDIPGKRPLEAKLIQRPMVLSAVNELRAKYNKPPLIMD
ncbi:MAG: PGPGW domain-containing protein [Acidobacteria bacterium]|nr:PGPGW domain-containing protein [Acidobacteriota bacterium]MCA1638187.1 PGPGW domain-containing protein [Acidobacteriota bacterium]